MSGITPSEALDLKRELWQWVGTPAADLWLTRKARDFSAYAIIGDDGYRNAVVSGCRAPTYVVAPDMQNLATAAAATMPRQDLLASDLPSPSGFLFFGMPHVVADLAQIDPGERASVIAISWRTVQTTVISRNAFGHRNPVKIVGIEIFSYEDAQADTWPDWMSDTEIKWTRQMLPKAIPLDMTFWPLKMDGITSDHSLVWAIDPAALLSIWTLMQQPLARVDIEQPDRPASKRARRAGLADSDVSVIRLRRVANAPPVEPGSREWHHRWIVRGHWRNQYLPSQQTHRLQWITEHVKGPDDKPLKLTEKVYSWQR